MYYYYYGELDFTMHAQDTQGTGVGAWSTVCGWSKVNSQLTGTVEWAGSQPSMVQFRSLGW